MVILGSESMFTHTKLHIYLQTAKHVRPILFQLGEDDTRLLHPALSTRMLQKDAFSSAAGLGSVRNRLHRQASTDTPTKRTRSIALRIGPGRLRSRAICVKTDQRTIIFGKFYPANLTYFINFEAC